MHQKKIQQAKEFEKNGKYWEAAKLYQESLILLNKNTGNEKEKSFCKQKIKQMNIKRSEEFTKIKTSHSFTEEEINQIQNEIHEILDTENIDELLNKLWKSRKIPNYAMMDSVEMPVMLGIVSLTSQDAEGNLLKDGSDPKSVWMSNLYDINEKLLLDIYLVPIFQRLINEGTIDAKILIDYINKKWVFWEEFITVWTTAIERFFAKDYISFLHVLIPRFESFFLDITSWISKNQIDTITARNQKNKKDDIWIQDKTLSEDFLRRSDVLKLWGKDLCEHINYLFFSQLWLKLRHELAHGRLEVKNANFTNSILVLYLFLIIISNFKQTDK